MGQCLRIASLPHCPIAPLPSWPITIVVVKGHYYSQHATALRAELGRAISRDAMRRLHAKSPARHFVVAIRQFAILALTTWALVRFDDAVGLDSAGVRAGIHGVQLHHPAARGAAPSGLRQTPSRRRAGARTGLRHSQRHLGDPIHALASRPSRRAGFERGRPEAASSLAEDQCPLVQAALCDAGAVSDLLPRGATRDGDVSGRSAANDRLGAAGVDRVPPERDRGAVVGLRAARRRFARTSSRCSSSSRSRSP